jgi:ATP-dependent RNA helicase DDX52/ROK1
MEKKISIKEKSIKKSKNNNQQSSINNLLFGVNKSISKENNIKNEIKEPIKEEKINKNKNEIICELKLKCKKLEKEIEIYAKKSIEELKITEKIKMKNINELKTKLNILKEKLQLELNIKYPNISEVEPLISFEEIQSVLKYRNNFTEIMKNIYKYEYPTSIQSISIPLINENKNIIAISETGSGKTLSYIIPCFHKSYLKKLKNEKNNKIIIILPTKELSKQIYNESLLFNKYYCDNNLGIKYINTSVIISINNNYNNFINNTDVYIGTPNNILKLINLCNNSILDLISYTIFDESDKYFELGFIDIIEQILQIISKKNNISKLFFSATISENLIEIINNNYADSINIRIGSKNLPAKNIIQEFIYCSNEEGKITELKNIFHKKIEFPVLVFIDGVNKIKYIYKKIKYECPNIECMFSKINKKEREEQINKFRLGDIFVLLCSDLLSRGIDFKNVKTIINYDCPYKITNYIHRIGRTGRAGKKGTSITFLEEKDKDNLYYISKLINDMKNENYEDIICPDWLINLCKQKNVNKKIGNNIDKNKVNNKKFIGKKRKKSN